MTQHRNSNNKDNKKLLDHKNRNIRGRKQERLRKTIVGYIILAVAIIILICSMLWMFQAAQKHGAKAAKANQIQKPEKISVKIGVARHKDHVSVAIFLGIGLLHLDEVAIGLGHRAVA